MAAPSIGGGITGTGSISRLLEDGINAIFQDEYKDYSPEYEKILTISKSKKNYETDVSYARFGLAKVKPEGAGLEFDSEQQGGQKKYTHVNYAIGTQITEEAIDDNLYQPMIPRSGKALKRSIMHTKEQKSANVFNNGYSTEKTWDAVSLFNASHLLIKGGTYSNVLPTAADLSETSLEDATIAVEDFRDDAGLLIMAMVETLHIPRQLRYEAARIIKSNLQNDTANNALNALKDQNAVPGGFHVNHRFEDPNNWFLRTNVMDGGKFFLRSEKTGMDNDFGTSNYMHKASCRFSVGVSDARQYFGSGEVP